MKTLICITTCNRLAYIKRYIWGYIDLCNKVNSFDFILSHDGFNQSYIDFCDEFDIPLIYSNDREGVGLSKNRVLKLFPNYNYYFFIEDDIEILDKYFFDLHINVSNIHNLPHLVCTSPRNIEKILKCDGYNLYFAKYGGATSCFFKGEELKKIGGWHPTFAKYRRFGHTEHTYRFYNASLLPAPFVVINKARLFMIAHSPPSVSNVDNVEINMETHLLKEEEILINEKLIFFPVTTLSEFFFNDYSMSFNKKVDEFLRKNNRKYPFTKGRERRIALAEHYFLRIRTTNNIVKKIFFFLKSILYNPINLPFKHFIKTNLNRIILK